MSKKENINEFDLIDSISQEKEADKLFRLEDNAAFSNCLRQILDNLYRKNPTRLNKHQLNLYLSMNLENSGQSCGILSCLQEWFPEHQDKFVNALKNIGAPKSADAIEKAISLLPENGIWFFKTSNEKTETLMSNYDREFSDYPDGCMPDLYRTYAELNKSEIIKWE